MVAPVTPRVLLRVVAPVTPRVEPTVAVLDTFTLVSEMSSVTTAFPTVSVPLTLKSLVLRSEDCTIAGVCSPTCANPSESNSAKNGSAIEMSNV